MLELGTGSRSGRGQTKGGRHATDPGHLVREVESGEQHLTYVTLRGRNAQEAERIVDGFVSVLRRMTPEERISASRHGGFTRWERWVWAARFPDEVPLVNGEFEWIACNLADLDSDDVALAAPIGRPVTSRRRSARSSPL